MLQLKKNFLVKCGLIGIGFFALYSPLYADQKQSLVDAEENTQDSDVMFSSDVFDSFDQESKHPLLRKSFGAYSDGLLGLNFGSAQKPLWGFVDRDARLVIPPKYKQVKPFSNGLAAVKIKNKWGYIDVQGNLKIPAQFDEVSDFSKLGFAVVKEGDDDNQTIYTINPEGKILYTLPKYLKLLEFPQSMNTLLVSYRSPAMLFNYKTNEKKLLPENLEEIEIYPDGSYQHFDQSEKQDAQSTNHQKSSNIQLAKSANCQFERGDIITVNAHKIGVRALSNQTNKTYGKATSALFDCDGKQLSEPFQKIELLAGGYWLTSKHHQTFLLDPFAKLIAEVHKPKQENISRRNDEYERSNVRQFGDWFVLQNAQGILLVNHQSGRVAQIHVNNPSVAFDQHLLAIYGEALEGNPKNPRQLFALFDKTGKNLISPNLQKTLSAYSATILFEDDLYSDSENLPILEVRKKRGKLPLAILIPTEYDKPAILTPDLQLVSKPEWLDMIGFEQSADQQYGVTQFPVLLINTAAGWNVINAKGDYILPEFYKDNSRSSSITFEKNALIVVGRDTRDASYFNMNGQKILVNDFMLLTQDIVIRARETLTGEQNQLYQISSKKVLYQFLSEDNINIQLVKKGLVIFVRDRKFGIVDINGRLLIDPLKNSFALGSINDYFIELVKDNADKKISSLFDYYAGKIILEGVIEVEEIKNGIFVANTMNGVYVIKQNQEPQLLYPKERIDLSDLKHSTSDWILLKPNRKQGILNQYGEWLVSDLEQQILMKNKDTQAPTIQTKSLDRLCGEETQKFPNGSIRVEFEKNLLALGDSLELNCTSLNQYGVAASIKTNDQTQTGWLTQESKWLFSGNFSRLGSLNDGLLAASQYDLRGGLYGYVNTQGVFVIPNRYTHAEDFNQQRAVVATPNEYQVISQDGQVILRLHKSCDYGAWQTADGKPLLTDISYDGKTLQPLQCNASQASTVRAKNKKK